MSKATRTGGPRAGEALSPPAQHQPGPPAGEQAGGSDPGHGQCRQELLEARALAVNLEKTVRWWSDCSARWKEKWGKANLEKVRCRRECQLLRQKVKALHQEVGQLKAELEAKSGKEQEEATMATSTCRGAGQGASAVARGERRPIYKGAELLNEEEERPATKEKDLGGVLADCLNSQCSLQSERGPGDKETVGFSIGQLEQPGQSRRGTRQHQEDMLLIPRQHEVPTRGMKQQTVTCMGKGANVAGIGQAVLLDHQSQP